MDNNLNEELVKRIDDLQKRIEVLEAWKTERERQQLSYPLDYVSQQIISNL